MRHRARYLIWDSVECLGRVSALGSLDCGSLAEKTLESEYDRVGGHEETGLGRRRCEPVGVLVGVVAKQ
jgi:hypothetical protein